MEFEFRPVKVEDVKQIDSWNFDGFVEKVEMKPYFESLEQTGKLRGPGGCEGYAALHDDDVVGLFEFNVNGRIMEIGLALRPDWIGKGLGAAYVERGIAFGVRHYEQDVDEIRLEVDEQNKAAIRVYEKIGFERMEQKDHDMEMRMSRSSFPS
ncbi:GNAT family N-acetyltransferase [Halobacillus litoralis]|uniref:GNAT family N-acetyltransferase n=1 Tax=Halobacillus litoralis TaxID=45668 RepID=A0A845EF99_9BACI|nr:GNAT family N-acetyltransferase [Halobacillus litoralis]MYL49898.1 GNAT family N-acetyltransferase [Halobacillus litoralis]